MATKGAAAPAANEAPPKKSKKMLFIIVGVVLALAGGGGGYYYMSAKKAAAAAEEENGHGDSKAHAKKPIFVPLDAFTVNLADPGAEKMAQISVSLQVSDPKIVEEIKAYMPAIRHNVLKIISSKESKDLLSSDGKERLADEIAIATAAPLGWTPSEDDEPAKPAKPAKAAAGSGHGDDAKDESKGDEPAKDAPEAKPEKPKSKKSKRRAPPPNPVEQVHFSQFIVQ